jgi:hypothetical protein
MALEHEEWRNHIASGLSLCCNQLGNYTGSFTYQASSTNRATWVAANNAQEASAAIHETDKALFQQANRYQQNLSAMGIYDDSDIAASNDQTTWRAQFTEDDASLPAAYTSGRR